MWGRLFFVHAGMIPWKRGVGRLNEIYVILDGVVKTSIYCVVCPVAIRRHTTCVVKTRHRTLLLGVCATCILCFYLAIFKHCLDFLRVHHKG